MPRNYSIKDTIQQAKDKIHHNKIKKLQDDAEPKIIKFTPPADNVIRFDNEKEDKPTDKKWYQFWK